MNLMPFRLGLRLKLLEFRKKTKLQHLTPNFSPGFTLIELLVVIAIIGILASLATYSYTDSQKKSRDSRRKSDLTAIQKAFELMKQDTAGNYSYPFCTGAAVPSCALTNANTTPAITSSYIKAIPVDPKTGLGYTYKPLTSAATDCTTAGACVTYSLVACLENLKDPQKDSSAAGGNGFPQNTICTGASPATSSYTITNL